MHIINNHPTPLGLPNGQVLEPRHPTPVMDWDNLKKNAVVKAWLKANILSEGAALPPSKFDPVDKDAIVAKLASYGVKAHKQSSPAKLQAMLADAEAKFISLYGSDILPSQVQLSETKTVTLGDVVRAAFLASGLRVDEWNALEADDREAKLQAAVDAMTAAEDAGDAE